MEIQEEEPTPSAVPSRRPDAASPTEQLATFVSASVFPQLPSATVEYTKKLLLDGIGCLLSGTQGDPGKMAARAFAHMRTGSEGPCRIYVDSSRGAPRDAAFVNGITLYSVGVNDIHRPSTSHPGGCVVPAVLAVGEWLRSPGRDMIVAMAMGYELMGRLGRAMIPSHWDCGFHPTGTFGAFGSTAAVGRLLQLSPQQMTCALGIAGSQAAGNKAFQTDGSLTMVFHAGRSAENGVEAALLAREGFTGPRTVLEDPNGFCVSGTRELRLDALTAGLGEAYEIDATSFRPFYGCTLTISASAAIAEIMERSPRRAASDIAAIAVRGHPHALHDVDNVDPRTLLAARLSMQFNVALVVQREETFVGDITDADLFDPTIRALLPKVELIDDPQMTMWGNAVTVRFADGRVETAEVLLPKGDPENPMTWDDTEAKFMKLTRPLGNAEAAGRIVGIVRRLEHTNGRDLADALAAMLKAAPR